MIRQTVFAVSFYIFDFIAPEFEKSLQIKPSEMETKAEILENVSACPIPNLWIQGSRGRLLWGIDLQRER